MTDLAVAEQSAAHSAVEEDAALSRRPLSLALQALLLNEDSYALAGSKPAPARRGALTLLSILAVVVLARLIAFGLGWLTSPQLAPVQSALYDQIVESSWYANRVAVSAEGAAGFETRYKLAWDGLRTLIGIPTWERLLASLVSLVVFTLLAWLLYSLLAHGLARWLGAQASLGQALGVFALAYAPLLFLVVELVPGARVPIVLLFLALLVAKYLGSKSLYRLTTGYTLAVVLGPYLIGGVALAGLLLFGAAYGLQGVPLMDRLLRGLEMLPLGAW